MNAASVIKYHWRRRWLLMAVFVVATLAITLMSAWSLLSFMREVNMTIDARGQIVDHVSYTGVSILDDPSQLLNTSSFGMLMFILALCTINRDRRFLVSCSVPRYRIWLGTCLFLIATAVGLTILGTFVVPAICRAALLLLGIPLKGGWDLGMLLTGGNTDILKSCAASCMEMIGTAGWSMLLGYLLLRWWKPILILIGAGIAAIILLVQMIQWETFVVQWLAHLEDWVRWAADQLIPWIREFYSQDNQLTWSAYECGAGILFMGLSYLIMRGMKVT